MRYAAGNRMRNEVTYYPVLKAGNVIDETVGKPWVCTHPESFFESDLCLVRYCCWKAQR